METVVEKVDVEQETAQEAMELQVVEQGVIEEFGERIAEQRIAVVAAAAAVQPLVEMPSPENAVAVNMPAVEIKCVFGKRDLQKGLSKLKPVWPVRGRRPSEPPTAR